MALYDRFRGRDDAGAEASKLPIWPAITTVAEILSDELTDSEAIARFDLDAGEQAEFAQTKLKVQTDITNIVTALTTVGIATETATTIAKAVIRNAVTQTLMRAELEYDTRAEFNAALGIS